MSKFYKTGVGVGIMVIKDQKILLGLRNEDSVKADSELHGEGTWTMPGGKVDYKEGIKEAALRELEEENGLLANNEDLTIVSFANEVNEDAHFITIGFVCTRFDGTPEIKEPDEITKWEWFDMNNLPSPIFKPSMKIINNYRNGVLYTDEK